MFVFNCYCLIGQIYKYILNKKLQFKTLTFFYNNFNKIKNPALLIQGLKTKKNKKQL